MKYKTTVNDFITTTENDCKILISAQKVERIPIIILTIYKILYQKKIPAKIGGWETILAMFLRSWPFQP